MGMIFNACVEDGYNENWQKRCQELAQGTCKSLRNQKKFNDAKQFLERQGSTVDLLDIAALVSSTQSGSDINGTGGGNQFCAILTTPFPFSPLLGKNFENGQTASAFANAYNRIQSLNHSGSTPAKQERPDTKPTDSTKPYLPCKEDFETAYRKLSKLGDSISIDSVLDQIEVKANNERHLLKSNWRIITEKNIEVWSKK